MKRRVLCVFSLIFWFIILSTCLSIRIEQLMIPTVVTIETKEFDREPQIPADALFYDDSGMHLYHAYIVGGWEYGLHAQEADANDYYINEDVLMVSPGRFIRYATRTLRPDEEVIIQEGIQYADDNWIVIWPESIPTYSLNSEEMSVKVQTDNALLISVTQAERPFMADRARTYIETGKDEFYYYEAPDSALYSLADLKQFMDSMLLLGLLIGMVLFTLMLWGHSCVLSGRYRENKKPLILNGSIAMVMLMLVPLILHFVDLPSSLLPQYHITDFAHYAAEFGKLFHVLHAFADSGSAVAENAIRYAESRVLWAFLIAGAGVLLAAVRILLHILVNRKPKKKPRHAAW